VKYREIVRLIEADGWRLSVQRGSHRQYEHPTKRGKVTIAGQANKDVTVRRGHDAEWRLPGTSVSRSSRVESRPSPLTR
jgi:predicted RNA binding protein YcfA (HicA-like mRNA interferase family)